MVWILWELIILETQNRDNFIKKQILSLYELYKFQYTSRKRNKRLPYLYQSICYLTHNININIPLIFDKTIYIQACINNNQMFKSKKINEHKDIDGTEIAKAVSMLIADKSKRLSMHLAGPTLIDGRGSERVASAIFSIITRYLGHLRSGNELRNSIDPPERFARARVST